MRIPRIYTQHELQVSNKASLETSAAKHIKDVLRMSTGNQVILFNGDGHDYSGSICELSKKSVCVLIEKRQSLSNESPLSIHLLQPLCRAEKLDWCIQKATELGINEITLFNSTRVNVNITAARLDKKMAHWRSVIESACEQSGRATIPTINSPTPFNDAVNKTSLDAIKLIASPTAETIKLTPTNKVSTSCICAVGPEGGFNQDEILQAEHQGFHPIKMGPRVLRLETAVISALTLCQSHWGDFK